MRSRVLVRGRQVRDARGRATPALSSAGSASAAHSRVSDMARSRSASKETFISIVRSIFPGSRPASRAPVSTAGSSVSRYSSSPLPLVQMKPSASLPANVAVCGPAAAIYSGTPSLGLSKIFAPRVLKYLPSKVT